MRKLLACLVLTSGLLAGCGGVALPSFGAPTAQPPVPGVQVTKVVDGDTIKVQQDGAEVTIRVLGIDTPETKDPRKPVQCQGPEASAAATDILLGQTVTLEADPTQDDLDVYGRLLRYVRLGDGQDYSEVMARRGLARSYVYERKPVQHAPAIEEAEREARDAGRGVWSC